MKTNSFQDAIKSYLDERAKTDELFYKAYTKSNKSLKECCDYIMGEAKKRGNAVAMTNEEVFGMAVHYYDEDNITVNKLPDSIRTSVSSPKVELTEEDKKKAREEAIKRLVEEQYASIKKKPNKKKEEDIQQMSLF